MTDLDLWNALVAFLLPLVISRINQEKWNNRTKVFATVVSCLIVSAGTSALSGDLTGNYVRSLLIIFWGAVTIYKAFWQPVGLRGR